MHTIGIIILSTAVSTKLITAPVREPVNLNKE